MSKDEKIAKLTSENQALRQQKGLLEFQVAELRRLIYSSKKERFVPTPVDDQQGNLFVDVTPEEQPSDEVSTQSKASKSNNTSTKHTKKKKHPGRKPLPEHLPTEIKIIEPDVDTSGMKHIGYEESITLDYVLSELKKIITRRNKYLVTEATPLPLTNRAGTPLKEKQITKLEADESLIIISPIPSRPIPKSIAEAGLLAYIFIQKFIDHLPFYRQRQIFKRNYDWDLPSSTINDWFIACCTLLEPLYKKLEEQLFTSNAPSNYLQADESPIKVLESDEAKATHQGYMWVYRSPCKDIVVFQYRKGRGAHGPKEMLATYEGYLQTDGYKVYDKIAKSKNGQLLLVGCWAHARRKFFEALKYDEERASYFLEKMKSLYLHERVTKDFTPEDRQKYRMAHIVELMQQLHDWAAQEQYKVLPKTPIGKAIGYFLNQWEKLRRVLEDGRLELDNNRIENKIRPLALGRKNYLFAGNHQSAQRIAMMYSFFATCSAHDVNPYKWLKDVLEKIAETNMSELEKLLPLNWVDPENENEHSNIDTTS